MAITTKLAAMGLTLGQYAVVDSNGYPKGTTGVLSNGSAAGFALISALKSAGGQAGAPEEVNGTGDNRRTKHKWVVGAAELASLDLGVIHFDLTMHEAITGNKVQTLSDWSWAPAESNAQVGNIQSCVILTADGQEAGSPFGVQRYLNWVYPLLSITPLYANFSEAEVAEFQMRGSPTMASKTPWGETLGLSTHGATKMARFPFFTKDYPLTMHTIVENGTSTSFTLSYTPAGTQASNYIKVWRNGAILTSGHFTVTTATKSLTINTLGSAGDVVVVAYEATDILE